MIVHVCDRLSVLDYDVFVATDSKEITDVLNSYGYKWILTGNCKTGTDRVFLSVKDLNYDIYVNVQGDEPLIEPHDVEKVIKAKEMYYNKIIGTKSLLHDDDMNNVNVVKVSDNGIMTRKAIDTKYRQCGLYAFNRADLFKFHYSEKVETESIELTRLEKDDIMFVEITGCHAVDVPDDILKIENIMQSMGDECQSLGAKGEM